MCNIAVSRTYSCNRLKLLASRQHALFSVIFSKGHSHACQNTPWYQRCFLATRDPNGLNRHTKKLFFIKNVVFGLEITQINKIDQFSNFLAYSRFSLNPLGRIRPKWYNVPSLILILILILIRKTFWYICTQKPFLKAFFVQLPYTSVCSHNKMLFVGPLSLGA